MAIQYHTGNQAAPLQHMHSADIPIWRRDMVGNCDVIKEDRRTGQLVPQTDSQCPLVRIRHQWWDTLSQPLLSDTVRSRRLSFFGHLHRTDPSQDHYRALQACILGLPNDWRRRIGRPRQSWLRTVEADLRPMNLGLATSKRRAQDRSAWRKLVTTATSWQAPGEEKEEDRTIYYITLYTVICDHMSTLVYHNHHHSGHISLVTSTAGNIPSVHSCKYFGNFKEANGVCHIHCANILFSVFLLDSLLFARSDDPGYLGKIVRK